MDKNNNKATGAQRLLAGVQPDLESNTRVKVEISLLGLLGRATASKRLANIY